MCCEVENWSNLSQVTKQRQALVDAVLSIKSDVVFFDENKGQRS
jgi:energy-coupling factor transporter ATP-binding protein EcfA2